MDSLCQLINIRHRLSSVYHSQTNGLTEHFNKTLCNTLAKYVSDYGDTWDNFLNAALFAYRTVQNHTTKYTPFKLLYGREAVIPLDLQQTDHVDNDESIESQLQQHIDFIIKDFNELQLDA